MKEYLTDYIPNVNKKDVLRIICRDFSNHHHKTILDILNELSSDSDSYRIRLAVLKLSEGNVDKLKEYIAQANGDWRDVLAWAEYPRYFKIGFIGFEKLSLKERRKIIDDNRKQYEEWLKR